MKKHTIKVGLLLVVICLTVTNVALSKNVDQSRETRGTIVWVRGGFGVSARIDNFQIGDPLSNKSVDWHVKVTGNCVYFGESSGTIKPKALGLARTPVFPPELGYGDVKVTITITEHESSYLLEKVVRYGFMVGPFIFRLH